MSGNTTGIDNTALKFLPDRRWRGARSREVEVVERVEEVVAAANGRVRIPQTTPHSHVYPPLR